MKMVSARFVGAILGTVCLCGLLMPGILLAQYYDTPGLGQQPVSAHPQDYKPLGIRAGAFMLHPGVQLGAEFTDNTFYSADNEQDDTIFHVRPYITAQSTWTRHSLNIRLAADFARYNDFGERDYDDFFFGVNGRIDVKNRSFFTYTLDYLELHEGLNNRTSEQGVKPTEYTLYGGSVGYDHTFNRLQLMGKIGRNRLDFDNVLAADGRLINNQDRDRDFSFFTVRAGYQFKLDRQAFLAYTGYNVDYDEKIDRNGYDRGGDGYKIDAGLALSLTGKLDGQVFVSYHERKYDDPLLPKVDGWALGAGLQWNPTDLTSVYGAIASNVEETTYANSSGFLQTVYSLRVDHELTRFIQLSGFASYRDADYKSIDETVENRRTNDKIWRAGLGLNWFINRFMYLHGSYAYEKLDSSFMGDKYKVNTFWLMLGLER